MVLKFVEWAIGPSGIKILDWLDQRGLWIPGLVLAAALLAVVFPGPRERVFAWFGQARERLGLAPSAEERAQLADMQARVRGQAQADKSDSDKAKKRRQQ